MRLQLNKTDEEDESLVLQSSAIERLSGHNLQDQAGFFTSRSCSSSAAAAVEDADAPGQTAVEQLDELLCSSS